VRVLVGASSSKQPVHTGDKSCRKRRQIVAEAIVAENGNICCRICCRFWRQFVAVFGNFCRQCGQALRLPRLKSDRDEIRQDGLSRLTEADI